MRLGSSARDDDVRPGITAARPLPLCGQLVWLLLDGRLRQHRAAPSRHALMCKGERSVLRETIRLIERQRIRTEERPESQRFLRERLPGGLVVVC